MSGNLSRYRRMGYAHGKQSEHDRDCEDLCYTDHRCDTCEAPFNYDASDPCECGCRDEYHAARKYALGCSGPFSVTALERGYTTIGGDHIPTYYRESRDAWSMRDALRAARYLRDAYSYHHTMRGRTRRSKLDIRLSYVSRDDRAVQP